MGVLHSAAFPVFPGGPRFLNGGRFLRMLHLLSAMHTPSGDMTTVERPVLDDESVNDTDLERPANVILFNDEIHTFEEVIGQIIKATGCEKSKAEALTWQVHSTGKAAVYQGAMTECLRVVSVLEEIALHTHIEV